MLICRVLTLVFVLLVCGAASAAVTVDIQQSGSDVVATASGSLDTSNANSTATVTVLPIIYYAGPNDYDYAVGEGGANSSTAFTFAFGTTEPLNVAAVDEVADSSSGGPVGVSAGGLVYAPLGYVSGSDINASSTWNNATLQGLGLTPGSYVFDYGDDSITFNVIGPTSPPTSPPGGVAGVPVDSPVALALLAILIILGGAAALNRR